MTSNSELFSILDCLIISLNFQNSEGEKDSYNWYAYVNNDPINFIDPLGLAPTITDILIHKIKAIVPTYGNYAGPGWTGGKRLESSEDTPGTKEPIDALDEQAKDHDFAYGLATGDNDILAADLVLIEGAKALPEDPNEWASTTQNPKVADAYKNC